MKHTDIVVPRGTELKLHDFLALLGQWNAKINLVGKANPDDWWVRHILDSMQIVPFLPHGRGTILDLGSGAGFPGMILAIATSRPVHLVESDRRKAAFLTEAVRVLNLEDVWVHNVRIEAASLPPATLITARALTSLTNLLSYAYRLLMPGGVALFPKGRTWERELTAASVDWNMHVERFQSRTDPQSAIFRISEISPAGAKA